MIFEYLNFALNCLAVFFLTIIFSFYRSSKYRIFDNKNFSKNFINSLFIGNSRSLVIELELVRIINPSDLKSNLPAKIKFLWGEEETMY